MSEIIKTAQEERKKEALESIKKLTEKGVIKGDEILSFFAALNPKKYLKAALKEQGANLKLVSDEELNLLLDLGLDLRASVLIIPRFRKPKIYSAKFDFDPSKYKLDELILYFRPYFRDVDLEKYIIHLLWGSQSIKTYNNPDLKDALQKINKFFESENINAQIIKFPQIKKRSAKESICKNDFNIIFLDFAETLRMRHTKTEEEKKEEMQDYYERTREILFNYSVSSFIFVVSQLALMQNNILWFTKDEDNIFVPADFKRKLDIIHYFSVKYEFPIDLSLYVKEALLASVAYYYPHLVELRFSR